MVPIYLVLLFEVKTSISLIRRLTLLKNGEVDHEFLSRLVASKEAVYLLGSFLFTANFLNSFHWTGSCLAAVLA